MPLPPGLVLNPSTGAITGIPAAEGTFSLTATVTDSLGATASAVLGITVNLAPSQYDSLIIADQIELMGGPNGQPSVNPQCAGAIFLVQPGYSLSSPQPTTDIVGSLILDGERPFGYRASDRTMTLPIMIDCTAVTGDQFAALDGAYEVLMQAIDEQEWTLTWTRAGGQPLVFDCFRAQPTVISWGGADGQLVAPVGAVSLTFQALPYGRSDEPVQILVASPLPGNFPPPPPVVLDNFNPITGGDNFLTGPSAGFEGGLGTWHSGTNCSIAVSTAQANSGLSSLAVTSAAAGAMTATSCTAASILANGMPVNAGATVTVSAWFRAGATGRFVNAGADFYDGTGTLLSTARGSGVTDSAAGWVQATGLLTAPAGAAVCRLNTQILATGAAAEVHYVDDVSITVSQWQPSNRCVVGPQSANWDPANPPIASATGAGSQPGAYYAAAISPAADITGLTALSVWAGFGSDYWETWHKGPAVFSFELYDVSGNELSFSRTMTVSASDDSGAPKWQRLTAAIPQAQPGFDYTQVSSYTITVTNRGYHTLRYAQLYLDDLVANPQSIQNTPAVRGAMYSLLGVQGTARTTCSAEFQLPPGLVGSPVTVNLPGPTGTPQTWICPPGVTSLTTVTTQGAGGAGYVGGGGGGGCSVATSVAVTPLQQYTYVIGAGTQQNEPGQAPPAAVPTYFAGDTVTVTAGPGAAGTRTTGGAGGTGTSHNGGSGATGATGGNSGAGGGSAGTSGAGGNASGTTAGTAGAGGGAAGGAGTGSDRDGYPGQYPGGGAGGVNDIGDNYGGSGADGQITLTYTPSVSQFSTLIAHRPGPAAPPDLSPLVSFGLTDVPNGAIEYPVQSLTPGVYATFGGTYSVVAVANVWATPGTSRTVTVTVKQYEFAGGPSYSTSVSRTFVPNTDTFVPGGATLAQVPIVTLGELTLPLQDMAGDNTSALFTITINETPTSSTWLDCLLLDTTGQTVTVGIPTANAYTSFYIDEPDTSQAIGRVLGSNFGRAQAVSVMQNALVSGGPLFLEPADNLLLIYSAQGAPALSVSYFPKFWTGRTS